MFQKTVHPLILRINQRKGQHVWNLNIHPSFQINFSQQKKDVLWERSGVPQLNLLSLIMPNFQNRLLEDLFLWTSHSLWQRYTLYLYISKVISNKWRPWHVLQGHSLLVNDAAGVFYRQFNHPSTSTRLNCWTNGTIWVTDAGLSWGSLDDSKCHP